MNKLFSCKNIKLLNIVLLFFIFIVLSFSWRNAIVKYDDIMDYILFPFSFYHCRILAEVANILSINILPNLLGIHIQDFSWFSEGVLKAFCIICIIYVMNLAYYKFKKTDIIMPILSLSTFLFIFSQIYILSFFIAIEVASFFTGYLVPIIFYLFFWYKLEDFYVRNHAINRKDIYLFSFISLLVVTGTNEIFITTSVVLLMILSLEYVILSKSNSPFSPPPQTKLVNIHSYKKIFF